MAIRFRIGKFRLKGIRFPKWGVRGNLFAAFGVIAGMAIVISAGAAIVLAQLGNTMVDLSGRDIPRLAASLQLSAQSASLAGQGPALLASRSEESLSERSRKMKETQAIALQKLGEIIELGADKTVVAALTETVKNIDEMIQSLGSAARERLETAALHEKQYDTLGQGAGGVRCGFRAGDDGRARPAQRYPELRRSLVRRRHAGCTHRRTARQRHRQQQPDGIRHGGGAVGNQQRYARSDREGIQGDAGAGQIKPRSAAQKCRDQGLDGRGVQTAGARPGQGAHLQDPPEGARRRRLRPDHSGRNPQAQCRPWHQRAATGRRRAEGRPTPRPGRRGRRFRSPPW